MQFPVQERLPRGTCSYFSALQLASPSFRLLTAPPTNSGGSISINTDDNSDSINTLTTTTTRDSLHCFLSPNVLKLISPTRLLLSISSTLGMSLDTGSQKADQIAHRFFYKFTIVIDNARNILSEPREDPRSDKWASILLIWSLPYQK